MVVAALRSDWLRTKGTSRPSGATSRGRWLRTAGFRVSNVSSDSRRGELFRTDGGSSGGFLLMPELADRRPTEARTGDVVTSLGVARRASLAPRLGLLLLLAAAAVGSSSSEESSAQETSRWIGSRAFLLETTSARPERFDSGNCIVPSSIPAAAPGLSGGWISDDPPRPSPTDLGRGMMMNCNLTVKLQFTRRPKPTTRILED